VKRRKSQYDYVQDPDCKDYYEWLKKPDPEDPASVFVSRSVLTLQVQ
jgi:hypothetical protein